MALVVNDLTATVADVTVNTVMYPGHIHVLCGPPGAGKTTLLKEINRGPAPPTQLRRLTTRGLRKEEHDRGSKSLEYEFLQPVEFAERLSKGDIASLIEWNGNYYATQLTELEKSLHQDEHSILFEDIPSAIALQDRFPENITVVFLFTATEAEMLQGLDFAAYEESRNEYLLEWRRRLGLKYDDAEKAGGRTPNESGRDDYIRKKMTRAIPDLAFIVGKLRKPHGIRVLANRKDKLDEAVHEFLSIMREPKSPGESVVLRSSADGDVNSSKFGLQKSPADFTVGELVAGLKTGQLWRAGAAVATILGLAFLVGTWVGALNAERQQPVATAQPSYVDAAPGTPLPVSVITTIEFEGSSLTVETARSSVRDREGKTADVEVVVLSKEASWKLRSTNTILLNNERLDMEKFFRTEGMQDRFNGAIDLVAVGASSEEGETALEQDRAARRANQLIHWLRGTVTSAPNLHSLRIGQHRDLGGSTPSTTSNQRRVVLLSVRKRERGIDLGEALHRDLKLNSAWPFSLDDYSEFSLDPAS